MLFGLPLVHWVSLIRIGLILVLPACWTVLLVLRAPLSLANRDLPVLLTITFPLVIESSYVITTILNMCPSERLRWLVIFIRLPFVH